MPPGVGGFLPRVFLNGFEDHDATRNVSSMVVHVTRRRATAEVEIHGPLPSGISSQGDVPRGLLGLMLTPDEELFSGRLTAVAAQLPSEAPPSVVLMATGTAPRAGSGSAVPLRFGAELESGTVRRTRAGSTARCTSRPSALRWGSLVDLTTHDPSFDGLLRVVELWYRFDGVRGLRVEFVAKT